MSWGESSLSWAEPAAEIFRKIRDSSVTVQSAFTIIQSQLRDAHARSWCQELWPGEAGWDITLYQTRGSGGDSGHWSRVTVVLVTGDHCVCVDRRLPTEEMRSLGWPSATVLCLEWGWVWRGKSPAAALTPESSFHRRHGDTETRRHWEGQFGYHRQHKTSPLNEDLDNNF